MRTTITLDEDVAAKLRTLVRRSGQPFKAVVNEALRRGLVPAPARAARTAFRVSARDLGATRPGVQLDDVGGLLDTIEGPLRR